MPTPTITWEKDRVAVPEETRSALCIVFIVVDDAVVYLPMYLPQRCCDKKKKTDRKLFISIVNK